MKYSQLLEKLNSLSSEQLEQEVAIVGIAFYKKADGLWILEDDMVNPSGEGMEPVSAYLDEPEYLEDEPIVAHKGDVFIALPEE